MTTRDEFDGARETLARIVRRLDTSAITDQMIAACRAEIASYTRLPEPVVAGQIMDIARRNVELFFASILDGRPPGASEFALFRESAKDRATEGMPLEDLLHGYRVGGRVCWRAIMDAALGPEDDKALLVGAELVMRYVDQVSSAVAQTYLDERQHLVSEEERRLRGLLDVLVAGEPVSVTRQEVARRIGFPLEGQYRPFAMSVKGAPAHVHSQMAAGLRARGILALTEGDRVTGLAPSAMESRVITERNALLAIGTATPVAELADALEEVRLLIEAGRMLGWTGEVTPEGHVTELLLLRSPRLATLLHERVLGPLEAYAARRSSELIETLQALIDNELDRRQTAACLHIHRNTLDYRLQRITELTGLDLGRPQDLTLVTLAFNQQYL